MNPAFEITNLVVQRSDRAVLEVGHLALEDGELLAIIGPNGAGKGTLLLVMARLLKADGGDHRLLRQQDLVAGLQARPELDPRNPSSALALSEEARAIALGEDPPVPRLLGAGPAEVAAAREAHRRNARALRELRDWSQALVLAGGAQRRTEAVGFNLWLTACSCRNRARSGTSPTSATLYAPGGTAPPNRKARMFWTVSLPR